MNYPKILVTRIGYYIVDKWGDVLSLDVYTTREEWRFYRGGGMASAWKLQRYIEDVKANHRIPDEFDFLGTEELVLTALGWKGTARWAKRGSYRYVDTSKSQ